MIRRIRYLGGVVCLFAAHSLMFQSAQAGILSGSFTDIVRGSNVNLSAAGPIDWVHWGLYTETSLDRKDGVVPQIGDFTLLDASTGYAFVYQFSDNFGGYSWSDGTPTLSETATTTGVWAYGVPAIDSGFQLTVPAGTNSRILKVFVGAFNAQGRFEAFLSDGSAAPYVDSTFGNIRNGPNRCYVLQYVADSADQTLTIRWRLAAPKGATANVTLQAATLSAAGANNPPVVMLTNPVNYASFQAPANISVAAKAFDLDGSVARVDFFEGTNKLGGITTSPYKIAWNNVSAGRYLLSAVARDNGGESSKSQTVEVYVYAGGGSLTGSVALPPISVDLTAEGSADWAHWGLATNTDFDHKEGVVQKISNFTAIGNRPVQRFADNYTAFAWTDGTPTLSANSASNGVYITGAGDGFLVTALADRTPRHLKIYAGCYGVQATFQAYLSDFSAAPYINTTALSNFYGSSYVVYTLDYTAASAGQYLTVSIRSTKLFDFDFGNVTLQAATLQGGPSDPLPVSLLTPKHHGTDCVISFPTQSGFSYSLQSTPSFTPIGWQTLTTVIGDGSIINVTNRNATESQRFYRVKIP